MSSTVHAPHAATDASADGDDVEHRDPNKRHRHDVGVVDHGPVSSEKVTRAIQVLLGLWIFLTVALVIWAMATPKDAGPAPAPGAATSAPAAPTAGSAPHPGSH